MTPLRAGLALAAVSAAVALAQAPSFDFMPDGGRGLFARVWPDAAAARAALAANTTLDQWSAALAGSGLAPQEARTLAGYLAANRIADPAALPPDGKDLALARCQSCHSLFAGYLMQRRDDPAWRGVFKSPFHVGIAMTPAELATFADYSAVNMPLRAQDVPPELRF